MLAAVRPQTPTECCESGSDSEFEASALHCTSVLTRNIPNNYTRSTLLELLDCHGFSASYDFVYLPMDHKRQAALGYAFLNFVSLTHAERFMKYFNGFLHWSVPSRKVQSRKVCVVVESHSDQSLADHTRRYRNNPVMLSSVPDEFKPAVFANGTRIPFP